MPQLDIFIFINTGIYLFIGFFGILVFNHLFILPSIGSLIKIRKKLVSQNNQGKAEQNILNKSNTEIKSISFEKFLQK